HAQQRGARSSHFRQGGPKRSFGLRGAALLRRVVHVVGGVLEVVLDLFVFLAQRVAPYFGRVLVRSAGLHAFDPRARKGRRTWQAGSWFLPWFGPQHANRASGFRPRNWSQFVARRLRGLLGRARVGRQRRCLPARSRSCVPCCSPRPSRPTRRTLPVRPLPRPRPMLRATSSAGSRSWSPGASST